MVKKDKFEKLYRRQITCQKFRFKNLNLNCIYRIFYKIAKRQIPAKKIRPIENCIYAIRAKMSDIFQVFEVIDIFTLLKISAGHFKYFVHALHERPP